MKQSELFPDYLAEVERQREQARRERARQRAHERRQELKELKRMETETELEPPKAKVIQFPSPRRKQHWDWGGDAS